MFLHPSIFCCCILELKNNKEETLPSAAFQFFISVFWGCAGCFSLAEAEEDRTGLCLLLKGHMDRTLEAFHALSTTGAWSSLSCSAQSRALSSMQPLSSLGFSVNRAHLGCFFAPLRASCSIAASTQRRLGLDCFHLFLILKGITFGSRELASIFIKLPFLEVGRKKPRLGLPRAESEPCQLATMLHSSKPEETQPFLHPQTPRAFWFPLSESVWVFCDHPAGRGWSRFGERNPPACFPACESSQHDSQQLPSPKLGLGSGLGWPGSEQK